jgi:hypothetical protein
MRRASFSACEPTATVSANPYVRDHGCGGQREHVRNRGSGGGGRSVRAGETDGGEHELGRRDREEEDAITGRSGDTHTLPLM